MATRWTLTGTHIGGSFGGGGVSVILPGARVRFSWMEFARISNGKLAETWEVYDHALEWKQLGVEVVQLN